MKIISSRNSRPFRRLSDWSMNMSGRSLKFGVAAALVILSTPIALAEEALSPDEMAALRKEGAAGVIAGQVIDGSGAVLDCSYNKRVISAELSSLRAIGKRLMVVQEDSKFEPLLAAIAGGLCTHLVIGARMAERLLEHAAPASEKAS